MQVDGGEMFRSRRVASYRDVDEARRALTDTFLPVDFPAARASGIIDMKLNAVKVGRLTCGYMEFHDAVRLETAEAENYHIDIPTSGRAMMRAGLGSPIYATRQTAGTFMPGRPVTIDSGDRFAQLSLMIPRSQLQLEVENLLGDGPARSLEFTPELDLTTPGAQLMMHTLRIIDEASELEDGQLAHPLATQRLEQVLLHSLLFAQPHNHSAALALPSPAAGARPISRAVELLRADPAHPWTVTELAAQVSLSVRSLQDGFRRSMDTTPMAFLRRLRLENVRDELGGAEPGSLKITEAAMRWGFVHLGRFATAYRSEFGERPSDTLRSVTLARRRKPLG
ncbi:MAG: AraC family transcriptional regulator [Leifsonia flava]